MNYDLIVRDSDSSVIQVKCTIVNSTGKVNYNLTVRDSDSSVIQVK